MHSIEVNQFIDGGFPPNELACLLDKKDEHDSDDPELKSIPRQYFDQHPKQLILLLNVVWCIRPLNPPNIRN